MSAHTHYALGPPPCWMTFFVSKTCIYIKEPSYYSSLTLAAYLGAGSIILLSNSMNSAYLIKVRQSNHHAWSHHLITASVATPSQCYTAYYVKLIADDLIMIIS